MGCRRGYYDDALAGSKDSRGWAMRTGHCKRLRHKEEGRESVRGRAAFARSVGKAQRCQWRLWSSEMGRKRQHGLALTAQRGLQECREEDLSMRDAFFEASAWGEGREIFEDADDWYTFHSDLDEDASHLELALTAVGNKCREGEGPKLMRLRSVPVTRSEVGDATKRANKALVPLEAWSELITTVRPWQSMCKAAREGATRSEAPETPARMQTRWELAAARAANWASENMEVQDTGMELTGNGTRRRKRHASHAGSLCHFENMQREFLRRHGSSIRCSLRECFLGDFAVKPVDPAQAVKDAFMGHCRGSLQSVRPTFHGTRGTVHESIFSSGFIIPGSGKGVSVRNGSAHGLGIYTAALHNAWLSRAFCTEPKMIVCAVVDDSKPLDQPAACGNYYISAQSQNVRHVGDAVVVFDPSRVVPLAEASGSCFRTDRLPSGSLARTSKRELSYLLEVKLAKFAERKTPANATRRAKRAARQKTVLVMAKLQAYFMRRAAVKRRQ